MAYRMPPVLVTLNGLEGHSPVAGLFKCNPSNICGVFYQISTERGPWATGGLLVFIREVALLWEKDYCDAVGQPTVQSSGGGTRSRSSVR